MYKCVSYLGDVECRRRRRFEASSLRPSLPIRETFIRPSIDDTVVSPGFSLPSLREMQSRSFTVAAVMVLGIAGHYTFIQPVTFCKVGALLP